MHKLARESKPGPVNKLLYLSTVLSCKQVETAQEQTKLSLKIGKRMLQVTLFIAN